MINGRDLSDHRGVSREVELQGETFLHFYCELCKRDFAKPIDAEEWQAVHVGLLQFIPLDELTARRWTSERCPGRPMLVELNHPHRIRPPFRSCATTL